MNIFTQFAQSYTTYDKSELEAQLFTQASATDTAAAAGLFLFFIVFIIFLSLVTYAVNAFLLARVFKKAGLAQWIAWVPFYNMWKFLELGGQQGFWAVLSVVPIVSYASLVFVYIAAYKVGLSFAKEGWWVLLAIFVPTVWLAILAFDSSKWHGKKPTVA